MNAQEEVLLPFPVLEVFINQKHNSKHVCPAPRVITVISKLLVVFTTYNTHILTIFEEPMLPIDLSVKNEITSLRDMSKHKKV